MTPSRKKPGVAFWASVVVVAIVLYVASIGPAGWVAQNVSFPDLLGCYHTFYAPLIWAYDHVPERIRDAMDWYAGLWG